MRNPRPITYPMPLRNRPGDTRAQRFTADLRSQLPIQRAGSGFKESGVPELAWLRGQHAGVFDAYLALKRKFPEAAEFLLGKFNMNRAGSLGRNP